MATKSIDWWVKSCLKDKGYPEKPLGSNNTKFGRRFGWTRVAWCVIYGWCKYAKAGVTLPVKTASCVVLYDACVRDGLHYTSDHCVPGDAVIRTWQHLARIAAGFDASKTHFQSVLYVKTVEGVKYLGLWGGNQGAGYVGPAVEWVPAGDASILGGLAFHRLFVAPVKEPLPHDRSKDVKSLPAVKSHKYPKVGDHANAAAAELSRRVKGKRITGAKARARYQQLRQRITNALHRGKKP